MSLAEWLQNEYVKLMKTRFVQIAITIESILFLESVCVTRHCNSYAGNHKILACSVAPKF